MFASHLLVFYQQIESTFPHISHLPMAAFSAEIRAIIRAIIKYTEAKTTLIWLSKPIPCDEIYPTGVEQSVAEGLKSLWVPHQFRNTPPDPSFLIMARSATESLIDDHNFGSLENFVVNVEHAREIRDEIKLATAKCNRAIADIRGRRDYEMRDQIAMIYAKK